MIFILNLLLFLSFGVFCDIKLKHVQILFRHGDRSPVQIYPNDRNQQLKWPYGIGQLTEEGIRQQYQLGQWFRRRYSILVGARLKNSNIYVRSTDYERTLMSAEANLAGFVHNESYQILPGLPWHPIAVHTVLGETDFLLDFDRCALYKTKIKELYKSDYFKKKFEPYKSTLRLVQQKTGWHNVTFGNIWKVYDTLFCEKTHNMTRDGWVTDDVWSDLSAINRLNWELMFYGNLAKYAGGILLFTMVENMKQFSLNRSRYHNDNKIIIYSGHDTDIAPLAKLLDFYDNTQPPYASCIIFELYYNSKTTDNWIVKVLYKNDTESIGAGDVFVKHIPGCDFDTCPLSQFIKVTKDKSLPKNEFIKACSVKVNIHIYVEGVFIAVCIGLLIFIVTMFFIRRQRNKGIRYSRFNGDKTIN